MAWFSLLRAGIVVPGVSPDTVDPEKVASSQLSDELSRNFCIAHRQVDNTSVDIVVSSTGMKLDIPPIAANFYCVSLIESSLIDCLDSIVFGFILAYHLELTPSQERKFKFILGAKKAKGL